MYKLQKNLKGEVVSVWHQETLSCIPMNPDNTDYQAYLRWLEAGNTPEPAEENQ
jgi:hypothetical protein